MAWRARQFLLLLNLRRTLAAAPQVTASAVRHVRPPLATTANRYSSSNVASTIIASQNLVPKRFGATAAAAAATRAAPSNDDVEQEQPPPLTKAESYWVNVPVAERIAQTKITDSGKTLLIEWENGRQSEFSSLWIRHHDRTSASYDYASQQPTVNHATITANSNDNPTLTHVHVNQSTNCLHYQLQGQEERGAPYFQGFVPVTLLAEADFLRYEMHENIENRRVTRLPNKVTRVKLPFKINTCADAEKMTMENDDEREKIMLQFQAEMYDALLHDGICVVTDIGCTTPGYVEKFIEHAMGMGVMRTFFGTTYHIRFKGTNADDFSYTSEKLDMHHDLPHQESAPGLQVLHCIANTVRGGEFILCDSLYICEQMRRECPEYLHTLARVPVVFQKVYGRELSVTNTDRDIARRGLSAHMRRAQPIVALNDRQEVVDCRFTWHNFGPMIMPRQDERPFLAALREFYTRSTDERLHVKLRYEPGTMLIFNNRRILHSRGAFDSSTGERHIEGAYVSIDEFRSKAVCTVKNGQQRGLEFKNFRAGQRIEPRVCNGDWL